VGVLNPYVFDSGFAKLPWPFISWPVTMWRPAIVMVGVVRPSVCLSHANISESE